MSFIKNALLNDTNFFYVIQIILKGNYKKTKVLLKIKRTVRMFSSYKTFTFILEGYQV